MKRWRAPSPLLFAAVLAAIFLFSSSTLAQQLGQQLAELQNQVINTYRSGNYQLAAKLGEENVAIVRQHLGDRHPVYAIAIGWNATIYMAMDRMDEAEQLFRQALAILQKTAPGSPPLAQAYNNLANVLFEQGKYVEAGPMLNAALSLYERLLPPDHPDLGLALHNLAALYRETRRLNEAEPILKRALAIAERNQSNDLKVSVASEYAFFYRDQNRFEEARPLLEQVVAIKEKLLPAQHPQLAASLHELGLIYSKLKLWPQAERTLRRTLEIREKVFPATHSATAATMNNLAVVYEEQGKYSQSETLKKNALAVFEKALPDDHPHLAALHQNLSVLYFRKKDWRTALDHSRKANAILIKRAEISTADMVNNAPSFTAQVVLANRAGASEAVFSAETFEIAQRALFTLAGYSLDQMASRQAIGNSPLSAVVREQQDMERRWRILDQALTATVAKGDIGEADRLRKETLVFAKAYLSLRERIQRDFPDYADLVAPKPLSLVETQKLLRPNEALFLVMNVAKAGAIPAETHGWLVTQSDARWFKISMSPDEIASKVRRLRCALDLVAWQSNDAPSCQKEFEGARSNHLLPFDYGASHQLYAALLGPVEHMIKDKHLLVVPSGSLAQLPFYVLVMEKPSVALGNTAKLNRDARWLLNQNTVTVLPSVASLKALRRTSKTAVAAKPMIGFGNPLLNGPDGSYAEAAKLARRKQNCQQTSTSEVAASRSVFKAVRSLKSRNGVVDVTDIVSQTPLPETADELCAIAKELGVSGDDIYLGSRFNEAEVKKLNDAGHLSNFRIVHFSTHGTLAGSFRENAEPGLLLTPPRQGSQRDDGYLTTSEITGLRLNADLVILSACYTAGGSQDDTDALAGMASAFFYAGARSALVSHWAVVSDTTVKLIVGMIKHANANTGIGRADAIRHSMLEILNKGEPIEANPAFWAPFVLVGEGAALQ